MKGVDKKGRAFWLCPFFYPPSQKTTPACRNRCLHGGLREDVHFGVQARALPVGLHKFMEAHFLFSC
jgi:hypothetical protein